MHPTITQILATPLRPDHPATLADVFGFMKNVDAYIEELDRLIAEEGPDAPHPVVPARRSADPDPLDPPNLRLPPR